MPLKKILKLFSILTLSILIAGPVQSMGLDRQAATKRSGSSTPLVHERRSGLVHWVIDGDTFDLETGERVRMIGIDTPEYMPWKKRADYYGKEASDFSKALLTNKKVYLETDIETKDRYGRSLAYVYLENGEFVNKVMVLEGYARAKFYRPNGLHYAELKEAEKQARQLRKGLWKLANSARSI